MTATIQSEKEATTAARPNKAAQKQNAPQIRYPFWFGGSASSFAAMTTHPMDLVKVRLQMRSGTMPSSMLGTFQYILKNDGFLGLYAGLSASLLRQITYSTTRFGIYEEVKTRLTKRNDGKQPSFPVLVAISSASGFIGGISGNAADITNVRMQGDAMLPPEKRRNYKHALDGMIRMAREEGLMSWFRGVLPNSTRAAVMTASQLASYDTFKKMLLWYTPMTDNLATHFTASFLAGVTAATATAPVDVIKTRVMSASGKSISIGTLLRELFAKEGAAWMFKGWVPSFLRLGPQTICTFIFLEMHRKAYRKLQGIEEPQ